MKQISLAYCGLLFLCASAACGPAGTDSNPNPNPNPTPRSGTPVTRTYQQGVAGYTATRAVGISTYGGLGTVGQYNANGSTFADGLNDWCTGTDITSQPYSEAWLIRFEELGIPATAQVTAASLTLFAYGNDTDSQLFLAGKYLAVPWNGGTPTSCVGCGAPVGWRYRDGTQNPWSGLGATGASDTQANLSFRLPASGFFSLGSAPKPYSTPLDVGVVQSWISGTNYGVRIIAGVDHVHMGHVQAQREVTSTRPLGMRPELSITYVE